MRMTAKKDHPFNKFGCGNLETLGKEPGARDELIKFHEKFYSSNIMSLCFLSKHPLDTMKSWVEEYYSPIENKYIPPNSHPSEIPYGDKELGQWFTILAQ